MKHNDSAHPQDAGPSPKRLAPQRESDLSPSQLEFARLLGRLLAEIWESERAAATSRQSSVDARNHPE
jgi:hypothetical protein